MRADDPARQPAAASTYIDDSLERRSPPPRRRPRSSSCSRSRPSWNVAPAQRSAASASKKLRPWAASNAGLPVLTLSRRWPHACQCSGWPPRRASGRSESRSIRSQRLGQRCLGKSSAARFPRRRPALASARRNRCSAVRMTMGLLRERFGRLRTCGQAIGDAELCHHVQRLRVPISAQQAEHLGPALTRPPRPRAPSARGTARVSRCVIGPTRPSPIVRPSIFVTAASSPIVPVQNTSSAR